MKKKLPIFLAVFFSIIGSIQIDAIEKTGESQNQTTAGTPDFSPPKDLKGPVFPIEDVIGKPNPETDKFFSEVINIMATLGLIISLILIIAWFLKRMVNSRYEQANDSSLIKVVDRRNLSPKSVVYLLEVEGKSLLVAESANGVVHLTTFNTPIEDAESAESQIPSAFKKILEQGKESK